jgi:hypothetical protein
MIDERDIYTAAADAISDNDLATYIHIHAEYSTLDWAGHDNRSERASRRLQPPPTAILFTLELMPIQPQNVLSSGGEHDTNY